MKRILFAPYNLGSEGCTALATGIGALRTEATKRFKRDVILVNWGRSDLQVRGTPFDVLNHPDAVASATNKLLCLNKLQDKGVSCVEHTTNLNRVKQWLNRNNVVYGRSILNGSQGDGIVLIHNENDIQACPLYTKGIPKAHEYRVHVFEDRVLDITKKRRRNETETSDYIKNLANGWVYCREDIEIPDGLIDCAISAVSALGLDFGAVDILYKKGTPYVLEVNTAPGLQGTTLDKYVECFNELKYM